ncbi:MAG TPA: ETC complex I subunit [Alphaproteobacteria bacterium]
MSVPKDHAPARIYRPASNAMQSGRRTPADWVLEFEPAGRQWPDPLMGWISSRDMDRQVTLHFKTKEQAIAYAEAHGIAYIVAQPHDRTVKPKSYAENFRPRATPRA